MGFDLRDSGFHILLAKDVPEMIGEKGDQISDLVNEFLERQGKKFQDIKGWILHPGGARLLGNVEIALGLTKCQTQPSWDILGNVGNLSSATILFILQEWLEKRPLKPGEYACCACRFWALIQRGVSLAIAMDISVIAFLALLLAVGLLRIFELRVSRRHQQQMMARGATRVNEPGFRWIVLFHTALLVGAALEVVLLRRPFIPALSAVMLCIFLAANGLRLWVVRTMGKHWNVQVMNSMSLGVVTSGPFHFVRHPNYAAVFLEVFSLPLVHTAWITSLLGSAAYAVTISRRIALEENVLFANPDYRAAMAGKPRFLPGLF